MWIDDVTASFQAGATSGWYVPLQQTLADYYPHGSIMPGRNFISADGAYRFGYQGQFAEADAETNFNNFELRQYDPVTGRWMTTDPFGQYHSPYLAMGNDPVNSVDPTGGFIDS